MARRYSRANSKQTAAMVITKRFVRRSCGVCIKDPARWYHLANDVHLCERCDKQVPKYSNFLARRHETLRIEGGMLVKREPGYSENSIFVDINQTKNSIKRARTSWGKPHTTYTSLCKVIKQENVLFEDSDTFQQVPAIFDNGGSSTGNEVFWTVPSFCSIKQPSDSSPSERLDSYNAYSHPSSALADAASRDNDAISLVVPDDFCEVDRFLGQRFYELETGIKSIMGEHIEGNCMATQNIVQKMETAIDEKSLSKVMSTDIGTDTSEEEYRINLSDFEPAEGVMDENCEMKEKPGRRLFLRLDYEAVLNAWSDRGSLWTDGMKPQIVPDDCDLELSSGMVTEIGALVPDVGEGCLTEDGQYANGNGAREARVLRYREKRRTRLFSKKIRYEVRKLNAERRPRVKGRFIKRSMSS